MLSKISVNQVDDVWFATQSIRYVECLHLMVVFLVVVVVVLYWWVKCVQLWRRLPGVVVINMVRASLWRWRDMGKYVWEYGTLGGTSLAW